MLYFVILKLKYNRNRDLPPLCLMIQQFQGQDDRCLILLLTKNHKLSNDEKNVIIAEVCRILFEIYNTPFGTLHTRKKIDQ